MYEEKFLSAKQKYVDLNKIPYATNTLGWEFDPVTSGFFKPKRLNPNWPYQSLYIDTLDYNVWKKYKEEFEALYMEYSKLPDYIEEPTTNADEEPTDDYGKVLEPLCDKYFPLDYASVFGLESLIPCLLRVNEVIYDEQTNQPKTRDVYVTESGKRLTKDEADELAVNDIIAMAEYRDKYAEAQAALEQVAVGTVEHKTASESLAAIVEPTCTLENGEWQTEQITESRPVALMHGFAYVPTGIKIKLDYTGIPTSTNPDESILIPGIGPDYGALLGGYYRPSTLADAKLFKKFPYTNLIPSSQYFWLQKEPLSLSTLSPANIAKIPTGEHTPITVVFEIFQKFKLNCGFPKKCGDLNDTELAINGKCGLEAFLNSSIRINRQGIDPSQMQDYYEQTRMAVSKWRRNLRSACEKSWNFVKRQSENVAARQMSMNNFMSVARESYPLMSFIPPNCLNTSVCQAQNQTLAQDTVGAMSDTIVNNIQQTTLLVSGMVDSFIDSTQQTITGIGAFASTAYQGAKNLLETFNLYQLCPRRFNDWISDASAAIGLPPGIDMFTQLQNIFTTDVLSMWNNLLDNCLTQTFMQDAINTNDAATGAQKVSIRNAFNAGNFDEFKEQIRKTPFKDVWTSKGQNLIDLGKTFNKPDFNFSKFKEMKGNFKRALKRFTKGYEISDPFKAAKEAQKRQNELDELVRQFTDEIRRLGVK